MTDSTITETNNNNNNNNSNKEEPPKRTVTKEKLRSIMEAASALTALGDEDDTPEESTSPPKDSTRTDETTENSEGSGGDKGLKRYIPDHKKPDAALTFPEKLMNLMRFADKQLPQEGFCIAWLQDGKSFVIRNPDDFTRKVLPKFFKATKFSSFTRKLYRWGFRQVNRGIGPDDPIIFGNEHFQRDDAEQMVKMRSVTAAGARRAEMHRVDFSFGTNNNNNSNGSKRPLDVGSYEEHERKRMLLDQLIHHKAASLVSNNMYGNNHQRVGGLAQALRPSMGLGPPSNQMSMGCNGMGMMPKRLDLLNPNALPTSTQSLMNNFIPQGGLTSSSGPAQQYPNASTAEIVNAAINALRFAS